MVNYHGIWYQHSTVIPITISFYNTEWWYYCGIAVYYCSKKFYNIGTWRQNVPQILAAKTDINILNSFCCLLFQLLKENQCLQQGIQISTLLGLASFIQLACLILTGKEDKSEMELFQ